MSIGGISGRDLSALTDQLQAFQQGNANLQKSDLTRFQSQLGDLVESFDTIDKNQDGISSQELQAFGQSQNQAPGASPAPAPSEPSPVQGVRGAGRPLSIAIELEIRNPSRGAKRGQGAEGLSADEMQSLKDQLGSNGGQVLQALSDLLGAVDGADGKRDGKLDLKKLLERLIQGQDSKGQDSASADAAATKDPSASPDADALAGTANPTGVSIQVTDTGSTGNTSMSDTKTNSATDATSSSKAADKADSRNGQIDWRAMFREDRDSAPVQPASEGSNAPNVHQRQIGTYTQVSSFTQVAFGISSFQARA